MNIRDASNAVLHPVTSMGLGMNKTKNLHRC